MTAPILAFAAGLLSLLSPCVLPLAPIVVAGAALRDPRGPIALAFGLALAFGVVGGAIASFGVELGDNATVRFTAAAIMVAAGVVMLAPALSLRAERALAPLARFGDALAERLPAAGLLGAFGAGVVLAFAWAPCVGPTLGAAFALAASGHSLAMAMATMFAFALGAALALLTAGFGFGRLAARARRNVAAHAQAGRIALAVVFIAAGGAILSGLDRALETALVRSMPDWLVAFATRV